MRRLKMMVSFRQKLLTAGMVLAISVSTFAQKGNDNDNKRPPKNPPQVVVQPKGEKPPPKESDKKDKRGKP
jgi:hypothetical protein